MLLAPPENPLKGAAGVFDVSTGGVYAVTPTWRGGNTANPAYSAAAVNCLNKSWQPPNISGNAAISESWELMTGRIRDLIRNDPVLTKALRMIVDLCVGSGIQSYSEAIDGPRGDYFEDLAEESDELFEKWVIEEADVSGRGTFYDMQRLSFKELVQTGFSGWLEVINPDSDRVSPLSYQLFEYEQLDRTRDRPASPGRNRIVNGIELNRFGRAVACYLYDVHPYDTYAVGPLVSPARGRVGFKSTRIPIERLILNFIPDRISSNIGITWFSCLVQTTRDLDKMLANELTSRAVAALMTLFVKRENPGSGLADALNAELADRPNQNIVSMGYPSVVEIQRDDDIGIAESKGGSRDADTFVNLMLGQVAMGAGMSINRLKGDPEQANLAAILSAHRDDERMIGPIQEHQINKLVRPIRTRFDSIAAALGHYSGVGVSADFYRQNKRRLQRYLIVPAGDPDIQQKDSSEAAIDRLRSGLTSPQMEIIRATGKSPRKVIKEIKRYFEDLERNGLGPPDWTKGAGGTYLPFVPLEEQPGAQQQAQGAVEAA